MFILKGDSEDEGKDKGKNPSAPDGRSGSASFAGCRVFILKGVSEDEEKNENPPAPLETEEFRGGQESPGEREPLVNFMRNVSANEVNCQAILCSKNHSNGEMRVRG